MTLARRDFLRLSTVVVATGVSAACTSEIGGSPKAGSPPPSSTETSRDDEPSGEAPSDRVRVAVFGDSEPDSYEDESGEITGQVPEVARAIFRRMGVADVEFLLMREPAQGLAMLASGEVDALGGLAVQPEMCGNVDFSPPDHVLLDALLVPTGNPKGLKTFTEIVSSGAKVAVLPETGREKAEAAGVATGQIVDLGYGDLVAAISSGTVDCAVSLEVVLRALAAGSGGKLEVTAPFTAPGEQPLAVAFGFAKGSELVEEFGERLRELQEEGDWLKISEEFGYTEDNLPGSDLTIEEACAG